MPSWYPEWAANQATSNRRPNVKTRVAKNRNASSVGKVSHWWRLAIHRDGTTTNGDPGLNFSQIRSTVRRLINCFPGCLSSRMARSLASDCEPRHCAGICRETAHASHLLGCPRIYPASVRLELRGTFRHAAPHAKEGRRRDPFVESEELATQVVIKLLKALFRLLLSLRLENLSTWV